MDIKANVNWQFTIGFDKDCSEVAGRVVDFVPLQKKHVIGLVRARM